jgi:hypothetical protein
MESFHPLRIAYRGWVVVGTMRDRSGFKIDPRCWSDLAAYLIVPTFTLFYWRGTWLLCEHYIFPNHLVRSGWGSLAIGYGGLALFFLCQYYGLVGHLYHEMVLPLPKKQFLLYCSRIESYFVGFFVVNAWRGLWLLQDIYLVPSDPTLSFWISHVLGVVVLIICQHFKSVYAPPAVYFTDTEFECTRLKFLTYSDQMGKAASIEMTSQSPVEESLV